MTPPARRDGTPDQKIYLSKAKPARKQHVQQPNSEHNDGEGIRLQKVLAQAGVASRRMLKEVGYPVERLVRTRIHTVQLGDQTPGTIRALNDAELSSLYKAVGM